MQITIGDWSVVSLFSALSRKDRWMKGSIELVARMLSSFLKSAPSPRSQYRISRNFLLSARSMFFNVCPVIYNLSTYLPGVHCWAPILVTRVQMRQHLTSAQLLAYCWVHSLACLIASASLFFQWSAIPSSRGSSQLGADMRAWMERRTYERKIEIVNKKAWQNKIWKLFEFVVCSKNYDLQLWFARLGTTCSSGYRGRYDLNEQKLSLYWNWRYFPA